MACKGMNNLERPIPKDNEEGIFITVKDGTNIFVYEYVPKNEYTSTIFIISGITGINHKSEKDVIESLSNIENRVVVIHPRGTGYSEGKRGDISDFSNFIDDYVEIIKGDKSFHDNNQKRILYGHSMSCAVALIIADKLQNIDGLILINPTYKMKNAEGMTPGIWEYIKFAFYYLFAQHVPIVNMAGDPSMIENENDRRESELRNNDPLLVKYFSMYYMFESKKLMDNMGEYAKKADYPLLLLYGKNDAIVDKAGCDQIFGAWKNANKNYEIINEGSHGKSTMLKGAEIIVNWIAKL
jgi:alpha-beta hydrolase superfamily lysophospholipase